jgi:hypothetical protein
MELLETGYGGRIDFEIVRLTLPVGEPSAFMIEHRTRLWGAELGHWP